MSKQTEAQKGNAVLIIIIIVAVLALVVWYVKNVPQYPTSTLPTIQNVADLNAASKDLDGTDLNQIDTAQSQINSDTSNF